MKKNRREFLKLSGIAGVGMGLGISKGFSEMNEASHLPVQDSNNDAETGVSIIGLYGPWAASLIERDLPSQSFRRKNFSNLKTWKKTARNTITARLGIPDIGKAPDVKIEKQYTYDGLHIEELSWQLPYGRRTKAVLLKPLNVSGKLPAILAFHCHGGNKYFGAEKITRISDDMHPLMKEHQKFYYEDRGWANEIAKRGYVVLVPDAFTFGSRRVWISPSTIR